MSNSLITMAPAAPDCSAIAVRLSAVRAALAATAAEWQRPVPRLVAVSKTQPAEAIQAAIAAGQRHFGENRVQEAAAKWPALRADCPDVTLHLIGPLQTNKARQAIALFDVIATLDRPRLAETLATLAGEGLRLPRLLIQVNIGEEPQKAGIAPTAADAFITQCRETLKLPITGLMAIPPVAQPAAPYFALLAKLAARHGLQDLSMGMSGDWQSAVALGATEVRLGSAIFGERPTPAA